MNMIQTLKQSCYYKKIFAASKQQIDQLFSILKDDASKSAVKNMLRSYTTFFRPRSFFWEKAADRQCKTYHFTTEDGYKVCGVENQYFLSDLFNLEREDSVYLDGGAFTGDTIRQFVTATNGKFEQIYAFEPDEKNCAILKEQVEKAGLLQRVKVFQMGMDCKDDRVQFSSSDASAHRGCAHIDESGDCEISVVNTAVFLKMHADQPLTFMKLDIEGKEADVLKNMADYLKEHKPDIAISIYHRLEDLWELPLFIKSLSSDYEIAIRHNTNYFTETVCYASTRANNGY